MSNQFYGGNHIHHHYHTQNNVTAPQRPVDTRSVWRQHPFVGALVAVIGFILALGVIVNFWYVVLPAVALGGGCYVGYKTVKSQRTLNAAIAARAQAEHEAYSRGDVAGLYGQYMPPKI